MVNYRHVLVGLEQMCVYMYKCEGRRRENSGRGGRCHDDDLRDPAAAANLSMCVRV